MQILSLSTATSAQPLTLFHNNHLQRLKIKTPQSCSSRDFHHSPNKLKIKTTQSYSSRLFLQTQLLKQQQHQPFGSSSFIGFNPLRVSVNYKEAVMKKKRHGFGAVCYSTPLTPQNLRWIPTISTAILMFARGTSIHKSFLVPLFALQAPSSIISWIQGEYGIWTAFLALLVRLFFFIPGELELPFMALILVIVAPYQVMNLRGTQEGVILSLVVAAFLAWQHYSRAGSLQKAFDQDSIIASLAITCSVAVPCFLLF